MNYTFEVAIPTDDGYVGRQCDNQDCKKYFKVFHESLKENMYCPYCSHEFNKEDLLTDDQANYLTDVATEKAKEWAVNELNKMFGDIAQGSDFLEFEGSSYKAKDIPPNYSEKQVDSEITCTKCNTKFQVYGIFGYCPGCKSENIQIYDANFDIIKKELEQNKSSNRNLRHAYNDIVSTFQIVCKKQANRITTDKVNFQDLFETRKFFKDQLNVDILSNLEPSEELALRRIFQKRHVYIHGDGTIGERYVKKIPEDIKLKGEKAELSFDEWEIGINSMKDVLNNLIKRAT